MLDFIKYKLMAWKDNKRGDGLMTKIIGLFIGLLLAAFLLPVAFEEMFQTDTANWSTSAGSIWDLLPLIAIVVILILFVSYVAYRRK